MRVVRWLAGLALIAAASIPSPAQAQSRPYIGFAYPAGGQQGTTTQIKIGGQILDGVEDVLITGPGIEARVLSYQRRLNPQDGQLLRELLRELKEQNPKPAEETPEPIDLTTAPLPPGPDDDDEALIARIERRLAEYVQTPASAAVANIVWIEVKLSADAPPGPRELRLVTPRGVTNALEFHVGQLPELNRKPMISAMLQVLGKEEAAQRKRPEEEEEQRFTLPCTLNGQIACGEINYYRFEARKGQRLVFRTAARQLIPFIADAVPGWFQPVLTLHTASGEEVAYNDDYRFNPDSVLLFEVPQDGEYILSITDALFRGREDFVYRISAGELPFITSSFPLGGPAGATPSVAVQGWNLDGAEVVTPGADPAPGIHPVTANRGGIASNRVAYAVDTLPEAVDTEPNDAEDSAQQMTLPVIVNGRIDQPDDQDVFRFDGRAGEAVVVAVQARRLGSPLDSKAWITDSAGKILAFNDDHEDLGAGVNTHHADSYLMVTLPADGTYRVHLADTARSGGEAYAYRLRIGPPSPDFELLVVPSSIAIRSNAAAPLDVHVIRKDGFTGPIKLTLKDPPEGFSAAPVTLAPDKTVARIAVKTTLAATEAPVSLIVEGTAAIDGKDVVHAAIPAEDRMQAFDWRHLVPAQDLRAVVFDPAVDPTTVRRAQRTTTAARP